eukprot:2044003-Ditylum_brightwellii.AAC.1
MDVIFNAPTEVLQRILEIFPKGANMIEDRGNLPLPLAFKHRLDKEKVSITKNTYLEEIEWWNCKRKIPMQCVIRDTC